MWGYVVNGLGSGHVLGAGSGSEENRGSPSYPGSVSNALRVLYGSMDLSVLSNRLIYLLALTGALAATGVAAWTLRRAGARRAAGAGAGVALPLLAPLLVLGASGLIAYVAASWGFPIRGPAGITRYIDADLNETWTRIANENYSAFGPIGIVALIAASALTVYAYARRRTDQRQLALACALPAFVALLALATVWSVWIVRFLVMPAVLTAPLLARLFTARTAAAAWVAVAALTAGLTITHDQAKPLRSHYGYGPPWQLSQHNALETNSRGDYAGALDAYRRLVPARACVGAVLGGNEPSYFLYGSRFQHHVAYLSVSDAVPSALRHGLFYVVISTGPNRWAADSFRDAGWTVRPLGSYWLLASSSPHAPGDCAV
jgi:hypothetical protein